MKKLAFFLALAMVSALCLTACTSTDANTTTTTAATTTKATEPQVTKPNFEETPTTEEETKAPELLDGSKFALDGKLDEYAGLHTIEVASTGTSELAPNANKKVVFYGAMTDAGLYLACDAYHDVYIGDNTTSWWLNSNFEFFIGSGNAQKYVYARGMDNDCNTSGVDVLAVMKTEQLDGTTKYHTVTEVFIAMEDLSESDILYNTIDIGVAWKTVGDMIIGSAAANQGEGGEDEYWIPTWPNSQSKPVVAPSGIYMPGDFEL